MDMFQGHLCYSKRKSYSNVTVTWSVCASAAARWIKHAMGEENEERVDR